MLQEQQAPTLINYLEFEKPVISYTYQTKGISMKIIKLLFLILIPGIIFSQNKSTLQLDIDLLLKKSFFNSAIAAIDVYDLTEGKILYKKNEDMLLHPASNLKLITTATALVFLGPDYKFTTSVYHTGEIVDSICYGDIYFAGGCDPDFTSENLDSLTKKIKAYGIKEIKGNLYGDVTMLDSLFWGHGWMWDDDHSKDFPYFTPLIIDDACVKIEYYPGGIGEKVNVNLIPGTDYFKVINSSQTIIKDSSDFLIRRDWVNRSNDISVTGNLYHMHEKDTVITNIAYPGKFFLELAKQSILNNGIKFNGEKDFKPLWANAEKIFSFERRFGDVINNLNKESDNLSAEMTLRSLANEYHGKPATAENGIKIVDSLITLVGFDPSVYRIVDGSGVSHYNLISAELLTQLLKHMHRDHPELYTVLYESLPVGGVDGTLERRMKNSPAYNNVHAKTGTLSGISTLSGYLTTKKNHLIAFSILMQNYKGSSKTAHYFQDEICKLLIELN